MKGNLIVQISEGLGNQLFMYAHVYALSKKLNKNLLIDDTTGYFKNKNSLRPHQKYMLNYFNISEDCAPDYFKYDTFSRNIYKKILIFFDNFKSNKKFLIEFSKKTNNKKVVNNYSVEKLTFNKNTYISGNFEDENYFFKYRKDLINIFSPKEKFLSSNIDILHKLKNTNSVSIHIRRNRYSDQIGIDDNYKNQTKSDNFTHDTIEYINRSIKYMIKHVENPHFFIWSNNFENFDNILKKIQIKNYELINTNDVINDFYLFKYAKHFIVGPSSYHWWGAWLNDSPNKICIRPSSLNPSNNENFWPKEWVSI